MKQILHSFFLFTTLAIVSAVFAYPAHAGRYEIIKGKGVEVCEAYEKNLNSFNSTEPMVCERKVDPKLTEFKKPDWTKPNTDQVRALEFDMGKILSRVLNRPEPKSESEITVRTEEDLGWPAKRRIARIDIDNDGTPETVLKQEDGECPFQRAFGVDIAVLTEDGKHYDLEKSKYISANFSINAARWNNDAGGDNMRTAGISRDELWGYTLYDVFLYKGMGYVDYWEMGKNYPDPRSGRLHVFLNKNHKTVEICTYRFG